MPATLRPEPPRLANVKPLLEARGLYQSYGEIDAVAGVDLIAYPNEVLGIVGESGSGKSTLLRLLNLQETPVAGSYELRIDGYHGINLFKLDRFARREVQIHHLGIVYQNPYLGLRMNNTSSGNVAERLIVAGERSYAILRRAAQQSLEASEFPAARMDAPPIQLSGGMQQRVQLAKAIALAPKLLLLDEPTSGLDVSVQAVVLDTLKRLQRRTRLTMILVSHDLGVIRTLADRVMVMRHGQVIETGLTDQVLEDPQAAYTQQLVHAKL
ncbi:MAG TPA: ATP-binding cassette domain-containing protein [Anaerolineae bacterium]|nr:ATP-binding cassette domain-containing protein [Anaerolineae bacterium]HMR65759.1 ATP-binding cassette domain-containing protein [Anaerolineae bacterium]